MRILTSTEKLIKKTAINKGYVIKMEVDTPEGSIAMVFSDYDLNADIPDSVFDLPQGVPILDMTGAI